MTRMTLTLGFLLLSSAAAQTCGGAKGLPNTVKPGVYRGTLGGLPVLLELTGNTLTGNPQYAYERLGLRIELQATQSGGKLILQESRYDSKADQEKATACFQLTVSGTALKGTWTKTGQKTGLPVNLNRLDATKLPLQLPATPGLLKLRRDDPLTFVLLNHPWVKAAGGRSMKEPLSGLSYLRLPGESAALNGALQDRQLQLATSILDCRANAEGSSGPGEYNVRSGPVYLTSKLVSYQDDVDYYCGGAHPDNYAEGVTLDRLTGESLKPTDLWPYLDDQALHKLYQSALSGVEAECREVLNTRETPTYTSALTKTGLQLTPTDLPHVAAACAESVVVPYAKLKEFTSPGLTYYSEFYR